MYVEAKYSPKSKASHKCLSLSLTVLLHRLSVQAKGQTLERLLKATLDEPVGDELVQGGCNVFVALHDFVRWKKSEGDEAANELLCLRDGVDRNEPELLHASPDALREMKEAQMRFRLGKAVRERIDQSQLKV